MTKKNKIEKFAFYYSNVLLIIIFFVSLKIFPLNKISIQVHNITAEEINKHTKRKDSTSQLKRKRAQIEQSGGDTPKQTPTKYSKQAEKQKSKCEILTKNFSSVIFAIVQLLTFKQVEKFIKSVIDYFRLSKLTHFFLKRLP